MPLVCQWARASCYRHCHLGGTPNTFIYIVWLLCDDRWITICDSDHLVTGAAIAACICSDPGPGDGVFQWTSRSDSDISIGDDWCSTAIVRSGSRSGTTRRCVYCTFYSKVWRTCDDRRCTVINSDQLIAGRKITTVVRSSPGPGDGVFLGTCRR